MADKRQPGRTVTGIRSWSVVLFKYASDNIFIDINSERFVDLLRDPGTAEPCVTPFQFDNGIYEFLCRTFGSWLSFSARGIQQSILALLEHVVKVQERRGS